ncbi:ATP synthase F1 subunit gamma [Thermoproteota archaeon]
MSNIRELKQRIQSVKKIRKITQAMKMVAASKFKRASEKAVNTRLYKQEISDILTAVYQRIEPDIKPVFFKDNNNSSQAVILITGDRGLCGAFNSSVLKTAEAFIKKQKTKVELYIFGNKGYTYFKRRDADIKRHFPHFVKDITLDKTAIALEPLIQAFLNGEVGKVWLIYNQYETALTSTVTRRQLLPFEESSIEQKASQEKDSQETNSQEKDNQERNSREKDSHEKNSQGIMADEKVRESLKSDFIYEQDITTLINHTIQHYLDFMLYQALLESQAGEEGARMAAMDSATDNAEEMIRTITLIYNRTRQAVITKEIAEIVGGAEALAG